MRDFVGWPALFVVDQEQQGGKNPVASAPCTRLAAEIARISAFLYRTVTGKCIEG